MMLKTIGGILAPYLQDLMCANYLKTLLLKTVLRGYSDLKYAWTKPAAAAPAIGTTMNNQS